MTTLEKSWTFSPWSEDRYVFLPAGAYNGNRFRALKLPYSPRVPEELVDGILTPVVITDVPRLSSAPEPSRIQLLSGDLAFPGFGWFDAKSRRAWFAWASKPGAAADWLWEIEESDDRTSVTFRIQSPGIRESPVYLMPMMQRQSPDPRPGARQTPVEVEVAEWDCGSIAGFFDRIFSIRSSITMPHEVKPVLPLSVAFDLIEEHYNRDSWIEEIDQYATDCNPASRYPFQTGWCGGMIATHGLLASGSALTRERILRSLESFFLNAPRPCGLFAGRCTRAGEWTSDFAHDAARPYTHRWTLTRRQGDALLFLLKQITALESDDEWKAPRAWDEALRACAECFVAIWRRDGQFGHFLDQETGDIHVGGSASGAIIPGALVLAARRFEVPEFLSVAAETGEFFTREFLACGLTTGGPGDACQNPDSESVAALVESFALLHEATGEARWLEHGKAAAALLATWVMPYNFPFPEGTEFHRLDIRTRGSVFANTQNKHSAPGICTHSGAGLLHLFRATGDERLMNLLCEIARFLPQVVSREDRPIRAKDGQALPPGWINERVNTSDWDDNVGGVFYGSCWCEVSLLLTFAELPGVYCRPDLGKVWALDHVGAVLDGSILRLHNPTDFPARVRVLIEGGDIPVTEEFVRIAALSEAMLSIHVRAA